MRWLLTAAFIALLAHAALAHDSWISQGGFRSPVTNEWCCGDVDCQVIPPERVRAQTGGYIVSMPRFEDGQHGTMLEVVPYAETLPSMDGQFWRCHRVDGVRRCFFAPPNNVSLPFRPAG